MFDKFTDRARLIVYYALKEAERAGSPAIDVDHLVAAICNYYESVALMMLQDLGVDPEVQILAARRRMQRGHTADPKVCLPTAPALTAVFERAQAEAKAFEMRHVGTEHLLLAILALTEGQPERIPVTYQAARDQFARMLKEEDASTLIFPGQPRPSRPPFPQFDRIVAALKAMDAEAKPIDGKPTGLSWYGGWARRDLKRPQTEVEWTKALADRLYCRREVPYPLDSAKRCDLRCDSCWIEVKGLWPAYWTKLGKRSIYEGYLFDPLKPSRLARSHTAARDITKLRTLTGERAISMGLVLVGFDDASNPCDQDIAEFARLAELADWSHRYTVWADPYRPGEAVKVWGWFRGRHTPAKPAS